MSGSRDVDISTSAKRSKLQPRRNPYWMNLAGNRGGVSLGYRRSEKGAGAWVAKVVINGVRVEQRIADADGEGASPGAMTYRNAVAAALEWSRQKHAAIEASAESSRQKVHTIRTAVEHYITARKKRSAVNGADAERRLTLHVLSDQKFALTPLAKLRSTDIQAWRDRLPVLDAEAGIAEGEPKGMAASTLNRLLNDV